MLKVIEATKGKIWLIVNLSRINLKATFITLIGLTIALSMISAYLVYMDTNKVDYYISLFDDADPFDKGELTFEMKVITDYSDENPINSSVIPSVNNRLNDQIDSFDLTDKLIQKSTFVKAVYPILFLNQSRNNLLLGTNITQSILDDCVNGSSLPSTSDEVLVYTYHKNNSFNIGDSFNLSIYRSPPAGILDIKRLYNVTLRIAGIITLESLRDDSYVDNIVRYNPADYILITGINSYFNILEMLNEEYGLLTGGNNTFPSYVSYVYETIIDRNYVVNVVTRSLIPLINKEKWEDIQGTIDLYIANIGDVPTSFRARILEYNRTFFASLLILSIPSLVLSFFLVRFSLGLINNNRLKTLFLLKMRGISMKFILVVLVTETLIIAAVASLLGVLFGIPLSILLLSSSNFLDFSQPVHITDIVITSQMVLISLMIGFFLTISAHIITILHLSRSTIVSTESEASKIKKRKARLFKGNLDLFLIIQGVLGLFILGIVLGLNKNNPNIDLLMAILPLIFLVLITSSISILIGTIMVFNRFIPVILQKIGFLLMKRDWWLFSVATKNLSVNINNTKRLTLLVVISISFLVILSSLPISINNQDIESTIYSQGTDLKIRIEPDDQAIINDLTTHLRLSLPEAKVIRVINTYHIEYINRHLYRYFYLGIEENFSQVVHWRDYCDDEALESHVNTLYSSTEEFPIIIDSITAARDKLDVNSTYLIKIPTTDGHLKINATITSIIDLLPGFITNMNADQSYIVTKISLLDSLSNNFTLTNGMTNSIWCKIPVSSNYDIIDEFIFISESYGIKKDNIDVLFNQQLTDANASNPNSNILWIVANFNFLSSLTVVVSIILLFTFTRVISHKNEVGLSRALGMQYKQIFILMFAELLLLFLISGIPGIIIGEISLLIIARILDPSLITGRGVPFVLCYDASSIVLIFGSILLITLLSGLITSLMAIRANISKILKVE
ncbi:MAG: FtsX-like permease family protein [Candidatus Hodarchaeales archaeon]